MKGKIKLSFFFTLRTSDDKFTRLLVVDRLRPFINDDDDDEDVWERLGLSCCCGAAFSGCFFVIDNSFYQMKQILEFENICESLFYLFLFITT